MKRYNITFAILMFILAGAILWAQISTPLRHKLESRNDRVISEVYEPEGTLRSLQTSRIGQGGTTPQSMADQLSGAGITVSNVQFIGRNLAGGSFSGGTSAGFGFDQGVMISSGAISNAIGPNNSASKSSNNNQPGDPDLDLLAGDDTFDAAVLEFDFVPQYDAVSLTYLLASEEYPEMIDYADVMAIYINGVNIALIPGTATPVSITSINHLVNSQYYVDNTPQNNNYNPPYTAPYDTQADGFTIPLQALASVTPGVVHHIKIAIADLGDSVYDSWLLLEENSFYSAAELAITLDNPADPIQGGVFNYRLQADNLGIIIAQNVAVDFRLPFGSEIGTLPAGVSANAGYYTWSIGALAAGESVELMIPALLQISPPGAGYAEISSTTLDNDLSNNRNLPYTPPQGEPDSYSVTEDSVLNVGIYEGLLLNDTVTSIPAPVVSALSQPQHGNLLLQGDGALSYTPQPDYQGSDGFTYRIWDGQNYSPAVSVSITVTNVNDPPVLNFPASFSLTEDIPLNINITAYTSDPDGDPLTVVNVLQWVNGNWTFSSPQLTLIPNPNYYGTTMVVIVVSDGQTSVESSPVQLITNPVVDLTCSPPALEFGTVLLGESSTQRLFIHNEGNSEAQIVPPYLGSSNPVFTFTPVSSTTIPAGGHVYTDITFTPAQNLEYEAVLQVHNNVFGESPLQVNLSGSALSQPVIAVDPQQIVLSLESGGSYSESISISNTGESGLNWNAALATGAPIWLSLSETSGSTAAGSNSQLDLQIALAGVASGNYSAQIVITSNAVNAPSLEIPVSITVTGDPHLVLDVSTVDFGTIYTGILHTQTLGVSNAGSSVLNISASTLPSQLSISPAQLDIPAFGSGVFTLNLFSLEQGAFTGTATLNSNDPLLPQVVVPVSATLVKPPTLSLNNYSVEAFGIAEQVVSAQLRITNTGSESLIWTAVVQDTGDGFDWMNYSPGNGTVLPGAQQVVNLSFNPAFLSPGARQAILLFNSNDVLNPTVAVSVTYIKQDYYYTDYDNNNNANTDIPDGDLGVVITHNSPLNPIEFNIYSNLPEVSSARLVIQAYDVEDLSGELSLAYLNGHYLGVMRGSANSTSHSIFEVDPAWVVPLGKNIVSIEVDVNEQGNGIVVNSGQLVLNNLVLDAQIRYIEPDKTSYIAGEAINLSIEVDTQLSSQAIITETRLLNYSGETLLSQSRALTIYAYLDDAFVEIISLPEILAAGYYTLEVAVYDQANGLQQDLLSTQISVLPNQPRLVLSANALDFGILPSGLPGTQMLIISNTGNEPLILSSLAGINSDVTAQPNSATIPPHDSAEFIITLQSAALGAYSSSLLIYSNDPGAPISNVLILAELIPNQAYISTNPTNLDFGVCFTGSQNLKQLMISNLGPLPLQISSITASDPLFQISPTSLELSYNQSQAVYIVFDPLVPGNYDGSLLIQSNAGNSSLLSLPISASAVYPPEINVTPASLSVAGEAGEIAMAELLVNNTGGSDLSWALIENLGKAVHFAGYDVSVAQYATIPNRSVIQLGGGAFTLSLWFKVESNLGGSPYGYAQTGGKQYLLSKSTDNKAGFFGIYSDGTDTATTNKNLAVVLRDPQGLRELKINNLLSLNEWYHAAVVYEGAEIRLYLNGNLLGSLPVAGFNGNTDAWVLGKYSLDPSRYYRFPGSLDEFRVFNAAKSQAYLQQTMYSRLSNQEPDLKGYWNFDAGDLSDSTIAHTHGTAYGALSFPDSDITVIPGWLSSYPAFGTTAPATGENLQLALDATTLLAGSYQATIGIRSNDMQTPLLEVPLQFNVAGEANVTVSPQTLDFGNVIINTVKNKSLSFTNNGSATLLLTNFSFGDPAYSCGPSQLSIPPQQSANLVISFQPPQTGNHNSSFTVSTNIASQPQLSIPLLGAGALPPVLSYNPAAFSVNLDYGSTLQQTLQISNQQGLPLEYELSLQETSRSNASGVYYNLHPYTKGMTWLNGRLYYVSYQDNTLKRYNPETETVEQSYPIHPAPYGITTDGTYLYIANASGIIYRYSSNGVLQPPYIFNPLITFTPTLAYAAGALYVSNVNNTNSTIYKLSLSGTLLGQYGSSLAQSPQIIHVPEHESFYALQPGQHRLVRFTITSGSVVPLDTLQIQMGPAHSLAHNGRDLYLLEQNKDFMTRHDDGIQEFNWVRLGSSSGNVPAGQSQNVILHFSALTSFEGSYQANLLLSSNDPAQSLVSIPLELGVTGQARIVVATSNLDFGQVYLGYPQSLPLYIENNGSAPLVLSGITAPAPFTASAGPVTIPPWQGYDLQVQYDPVALGAHSGVLAFSTNDPLNPHFTITLAGECIEAPNISVTPSLIEASLMNDASQDYQLNITNTGITALAYRLEIEQNLTPAGRGSAAEASKPEAGRLITDVIAEYPFFLHNAGAVVAEGFLWAVNNNSSELHKCSLSDAAIVQSYPINDRPYGIAWDGNSFWIGSQGGVLYRYPLASLQSGVQNVPQSLIYTNFGTFTALTCDGSSLVVANALSGEANTTFRRYSLNGQMLNEYFSTIKNISQLCRIPQYGSANLWAYQNIVVNMEPAGGKIHQITLSGSQAVSTRSKDCWDDAWTYTLAHDGNDFLISDIGGPLQRIDDGFWLGSTGYRGILGASESALLPVKIYTGGINGGAYSGQIKLHSNDPDTQVFTIPVNLLVQGYPSISVSPVTAVYDTTLIGEYRVKNFTIRNTGSDLLVINSISSSHPAFIPGTTAVNIPAGGAQVIQITFQPAAAGLLESMVSFSSNATGIPLYEIQLSGYGKTPAAAISIIPNPYDYGSVYTNATRSHTFRLRNPGTAALIVNGFSSSTGVFYTTKTFPFSVARGDSTTINIIFAPAAATAYDEAFSFSTNASPQPVYVLNLTGQGLAPLPEISVTPASLNFGTVVTGVPRSLNLDVHNTGQLPLVISNISSSYGGLSFSEQEFSVLPGQFHTVGITLTALEAGSLASSLQIASNDPDDPLLEVGFTANAVAGNAGISVDPITLNFGSVEIGSSHTQTLRITSTGNIPLVISSISSTNPAYAVSQSNAIINPGQYMDLLVIYTPQNPVAENGFLTLLNNTSSSPNLQISLFGSGRYPALYSVNPPVVDVYTNLVQQITQAINITNTGLGTVQYTIAVQGGTPAWMSFSPSAGNVSAGNTVPITLTLDTAGLNYDLYEANLMIQTNSTQQPVTTVPVLLNYSNYNLTTHDNEDNLGSGNPDYDMDVHLTQSSPLVPIEFNIFTDATAIQNAQLKLSCQGVHPAEVSRVYFNDQYLGTLAAPPVAIQESYFNINPAWVNLGTTEKNTIRINPDENSVDPAGTMVMLGKFDYNKLFSNASLVGMTAEPAIITPQSLLQVHQELTTNLYTQTVRIESRLYNSTNQQVLSLVSRVITLSAYQPGTTTATWNLNDLIPPGSYYVNVNVYDNLSNQLQDTGRLDLLVRPNVPVIAVTPETMNFGSLYPGYPATQVLTISNLGAATLQISNLLFSNVQYSAEHNTLSIVPGGSFDLEITALLTQLGTVNGQLTITSNDPGQQTLNVSLLASGIPAPQISAAPEAVNITMQQYDLATQQITIANTGGSPLQISQLGISGAGWINAQITETTLAPEEEAVLTLSFNSEGLEFGLYWADLNIFSNDPATPQLIIPIEVNISVITVVAAFSAEPLTGLAPLQVQFTSQAYTTDGSSIISWSWDFNNDGVEDSSLEHPLHTYTVPGSYSVRLTVVSNGRATHSYLRPNYIYVINNPPQAALPLPDFMLNEDEPLTGFDLSPYFSDPDGDTLSYSVSPSLNLEFVINGSLLDIIPAPDYNGSETIAITASDPFAVNVSQTAWVNVIAMNDGPQFVELPQSFSYLRWTSYSVDLSHYFTDPDTDPALITVSVSGNVNTTCSIDQHILTFGAVEDWFGTETVQITIDDNVRRATATASVDLIVLEGLVVDFYADVTDVLAGLPVNFYHTVQGNPNYFEWDFENDGIVDSYLEQPFFVYNLGALYSVRLRVMYIDSEGDTLHTGELVRPDYILVRGTNIPGGDQLGAWILAGSPYNITGSIVIPENELLTIAPDVQVNVLHEDISITVEGSLQVDTVNFSSLSPNGWRGIEIGETAVNTSLIGSTILDAELPLWIKGNALIQNCVIAKDSLLIFPGEWAVEIEGDINPVLDGLEIDYYFNGIQVQSGTGSANPTLSNIRVRNSTNAIRTDSYGIRLAGRVLPVFDDVEISDFTIGLFYNGYNLPQANQPTLSNIRVRNTTNAIRSVSTGIWLKNLLRVTVAQDSISECVIAIKAENDSPLLANQPTLSNIRIRNSTNAIRTDTWGIQMTGHIIPRLWDVEIDDFMNGIRLIGINAPLQNVQPMISNIRVRNTTNAIRPVGVGLFVQDYTRIHVVNDSLFGFLEGIKFINTQPQLANNPTLSNIRVRNSTNAIRNAGTAIYGSQNVNMTISDCLIQDYGVGVHTLGNASQIRRNLLVNNDNAVLVQGILPGYALSYNDMILTPDYFIDTGAAIKVDDVPQLNIHNNTIVNYPGLLWAQNSSLLFKQNIGWSDQDIAVPFVATNSTISATYNDIRYAAGVYPGTGNINADPLFSDPAALDFTLHYNSPCIDSGDPTMPPDPDGTVADMGAHYYEHNAGFTSDLRFVLPNTTIQFSNQSAGHPSAESQFFWDFNGDRNTDSTLENPTWTFTDLGRYDISLRVVSGSLADTLLLYNYVLVQNTLLPPPQNVQLLVVEDTDVRLIWDPVTHDISGNPVTPTYYIVYSNSLPHGQFRYQGLTPNNCEFTHFEGGVKRQMYYVVIAFIGSRAQLEDYLRSRSSIEIQPEEKPHPDNPDPKNNKLPVNGRAR